MRWVPIHMDDNPVTVEGNDREVVKGGGEFGGFKENFDVHGKSFRLINLYDSNILYIGRKVNTSLDKNQKKVKVFLIEIQSQQGGAPEVFRPY
jgi:hypothetical protein